MINQNLNIILKVKKNSNIMKLKSSLEKQKNTEKYIMLYVMTNNDVDGNDNDDDDNGNDSDTYNYDDDDDNDSDDFDENSPFTTTHPQAVYTSRLLNPFI